MTDASSAVEPEESRPARNIARTATIALLIATLFWGFGFTWAKAAGSAVNASAQLPAGAALGPNLVLAMRFFLATLLWLIIFPDSRRGWNRSTVRRSLILGLLLSGGMVVQHLGLDRTSEAVSAFLTSLTIIGVPLLMTVVLRRPPKGLIWIGVVLATVGVWLMTGATPQGFGVGEVLGLACALMYSIDIIAVNMLVTPGDASRLTAGQFFVVATVTLIVCLCLPGGAESLNPNRLVEMALTPQIGWNVLLLALMPSVGAFGMQFRFQPLIDPTRAALLYLMEPIFAAAYAFIAVGSTMSPIALGGAALILVANLLVEILQSRRKDQAELPVPVID